MRRRVLIPLTLFGILTVCALLFPLGIAIAHERTQQVQLQRSDSMDRIVQRASSALVSGDATGLNRYLDRIHAVYGERVVVVDTAFRPVAAGAGMRPDGDAAAPLASALRGVGPTEIPTVLPWSRDTRIVAQPVMAQDTSPVGAVALEVHLSAAKHDVTRGLLVACLAGAAVLALLISASVWWTRWIIRPVRALDLAANALAEEQTYRPGVESGPPELRRLTHSFQRMALNVERALEQQRGLVADTSHQLRNPLAAVRIRIDALAAGAPEDQDEIEAIDHDLDRLERTVGRLLELANAEHRAGVRRAAGDDEPGESVLTSAADLAEPHRATLARAGLDLVTTGSEVGVRFLPEDLEEVVEILLDNAAKYAGTGATVTVDLRQSGETAELSVSDSGPGLNDEDMARLGTRFWRASGQGGTAGSSLPVGSGLGHAILEQLAHANAATVDVGHAPEGGLRVRIGMATA